MAAGIRPALPGTPAPLFLMESRVSPFLRPKWEWMLRPPEWPQSRLGCQFRLAAAPAVVHSILRRLSRKLALRRPPQQLACGPQHRVSKQAVARLELRWHPEL